MRGTSVSLGPYGGLALHDTARGGVAHLFAGAVGRLRINYVELGGNIEVSDRVQESWRLLGGFVGGYIPFENWVDLELAVGAGVRHYLNPDQRYGTGGFDVKVPAITLRAGFSDRLGEGIFGLRLGGEILFGTKGFAPLCRTQAVHVIMPDVKHCGGLLEMTHIAALARADGVAVAPHNPSGPVSHVASLHVCSTLGACDLLEMQFDESPLFDAFCGHAIPSVRDAAATLPDGPGFGVALDRGALATHAAQPARVWRCD